jgi:hypothetical protein
MSGIREAPMRHLVLVVSIGFAIAAPASAEPAAKAPFGCEARAGSVCTFRIFYPGGRSRDVVLPAGMKQAIPEVQIGRDTYCVAVNAKPRNNTCQRKTIGAGTNS